MMKLTLPILTLAATIFAGGAFAFDPDDLKKLQDTGNCVSCNLKNIKVIVADLSRSDLRDADLSGAVLRDADLRDAYLNNANLAAADLSNANLQRTYMNGAILCNTTMPDGSVIYSGC